MANVTFTRSSDATARAASTQGLITFNTGNHCISLGTGSAAVPMNLGLTLLKRTRVVIDTTKTTNGHSASKSFAGFVVGIENIIATPSGSKPPSMYVNKYAFSASGCTTTLQGAQLGVLDVNLYPDTSIGADIYYI